MGTSEVSGGKRRLWGPLWSLFYHPTNSTAQLSATDIRNPTFTPDVEGVYVFALRAQDAAGRLGIRRLTFVASNLSQPRVSVTGHSSLSFQITVPSVVGRNYTLEWAAKPNAEGAKWTPLTPVAGTGGPLTLRPDAWMLYPGSISFFRVVVTP